MIGNWIAHAVLFVRVTQQTNRARIKFLCGILFIADVVLINLHGTGAWATGSIRFYHWVHRHQAVILAIYIQIEAEIINMLVCSTHDIVIDKRAVARVIFRRLIVHGFRFNTFHRFDARSTGINANSAVFMEDPVKNVVIVTHCTDPAHHQLPAFGTDVGLAHFLMLILRPGITFKYRDSARDLHRHASVVGDGFIKEHCVRRGIFTTSNW